MDSHSWRASPQTSATIAMAHRMELAAIVITGNNDYRRSAVPQAHQRTSQACGEVVRRTA
jgi:hypothetical protein